MCRLFGVRARVPVNVHRPLALAPNSLRLQSREHPHGWGIAHYDQNLPAVAHSLEPAHADPEFERVSSAIASETLLAHVRLASVGGLTRENAHPFVFERWAFAHNGTVQRFADHRAEIESWIDPIFRALIRGETDSERCFYLFLTHLRAIAGSTGKVGIDAVGRAIAKTAHRVAELTDTPEKPSGLNFLVTDGRLMLACRKHRTLFYADHERMDATPPPNGTRLAGFTVSSEVPSAEHPWYEVPEDGVVGIDEDFHLWTTNFQTLLG